MVICQFLARGLRGFLIGQVLLARMFVRRFVSTVFYYDYQT